MAEKFVIKQHTDAIPPAGGAAPERRDVPLTGPGNGTVNTSRPMRDALSAPSHSGPAEQTGRVSSAHTKATFPVVPVDTQRNDPAESELPAPRSGHADEIPDLSNADGTPPRGGAETTNSETDGDSSPPLPEGVTIKNVAVNPDQTPSDLHFNAINGGQPVGKIRAQLVPTNDTDGHHVVAKLKLLEVNVRLRNQGIGKNLLRRMETQAREAGAKSVEGVVDNAMLLNGGASMPEFLAGRGYTVNLVEGRFTKPLDGSQSPGTIIEAERPVGDERKEYLNKMRGHVEVLPKEAYYDKVEDNNLKYADIGSAYYRWEHGTVEGIIINEETLHGWGDDFSHLKDILVEERAVEMWLTRGLGPDDIKGHEQAHREAVLAAVQKAQAEDKLEDFLTLRSWQLHKFAEDEKRTNAELKNPKALDELALYENTAQLVREQSNGSEARIAEAENPGLVETSQEVVDDIVDSAESAYRIIGSTLGINPENVYSTNHCEEVVDQMGYHLCNKLNKGYSAARIDATFRFMPHQYISIYPPNSDRRIIADPTWQQLLPESERTPEKPKVLIGTPEEVGSQLRSYGFTQEEIATWVPVKKTITDRYQDRERVTTPHEETSASEKSIYETVVMPGENSGRIFRRGGIIGSGTHANVYIAVEGDQEFAIKLQISPEVSEYAFELIKEAGLQASFNHPHITPVEFFDTTTALVPGIEVPFIVMPLAEGTLEQAIGRTPLPIDEALRVALHTADGVAALHEHGILYSGLDIDDILLFRDPQGNSIWKITDFGEAKTIEEEKIAYRARNMSEIDPARDEQFEWALMLMYPTLTGRRFLPIDDDVPSISSLMGEENMTDLHRVLELVVNRAMQERPEDRYPSMAALRDDLQARSAEIEGANPGQPEDPFSHATETFNRFAADLQPGTLEHTAYLDLLAYEKAKAQGTIDLDEMEQEFMNITSISNIGWDVYLGTQDFDFFNEIFNEKKAVLVFAYNRGAQEILQGSNTEEIIKYFQAFRQARNLLGNYVTSVPVNETDESRRNIIAADRMQNDLQAKFAEVEAVSAPRAQFQVVESPQMMDSDALRPLPTLESPVPEIPTDFWNADVVRYNLTVIPLLAKDRIGPYRTDPTDRDRLKDDTGAHSIVLGAVTAGGENLAIKIGRSSHPIARQVFAREAFFHEQAYHLSPLVPELIDQGTLALQNINGGIEDFPVLVFREVPGRNLSRRHTNIPIEEAQRRFGLLAEAFDAIGTQIVHRDFTMRNAMLKFDEYGGEIVPIDFGLAAPVGTVTDIPLGNPAFRSPEHSRKGDRVTAATNTYQLGEVIRRALNSLGSRPVYLSDAANEVFLRATADDPTQRGSAIEIVSGLALAHRDSNTTHIPLG